MSDVLDDLFDSLQELEAGQSRPPVHLWHPQRCGEIDIHIDTQGQWFHEGGEISRHELVKLFASILRREADDYFLVTPVEKLAIRVDDVPFMAIDLNVKGAGRDAQFLFTTNVDDHVLVDAQHTLIMRDEKPYVHVRDGLEAKLTRAVYYPMVDLALQEGVELVIYSCGKRFSLGSFIE